MSLADQLRHRAAVARNHDALYDLTEALYASTDLAERYELAARIEALELAQADHLQASALARWTTALPSPEAIRGSAGTWREIAEQIGGEEGS